ncbi:D-amino acid aminotransferase [Methylobacter tundripaludum]|uniref:Aminodeoxychorismate lyase n=1 Tax=Methylobacter tundripaludum (strain ATCC BAA-1195 / DSM 17260 / SV96) TaxID=697282 RepID=G3ITR2_METTV|nr:D-amino acid aminotransferase [Methylobacter tundripaludum]EGW22583.1 D-amino-acid transaminase [Methylobacter tundripaludum SV96]
MDNKTVYLNGQYLPLADAKVSVMDRGFLFGDGIYEVIPSYSGSLFHFQEHMERLENSLSSIRLANPHDRAQWLEILTPLLDTSLDQYIYLQITRGIDSKRDHSFPENVTPTVFAMCSNIVPLANLDSGVKAISVDDSRWELCNVKATTLLANILLRQQAVEKGCAEAILVKDGYVTEGAASNIFAVIDGILITPPQGSEILPGITRDVILEIARKNNIPYSEDIISLDALKTASEIWLTSSTREIVPVVQLDNETIANGKPGPIWRIMNQLFQAYKQSRP